MHKNALYQSLSDLCSVRLYAYIRVELRLKCCLQADEYTDKFLQDEHSFDDYVREVRRYHRLADEITYTSVKVYITFQLCLTIASCRHTRGLRQHQADLSPQTMPTKLNLGPNFNLVEMV